MAEVPKICFYCTSWVAELDALDRKRQWQISPESGLRQVPPIYGKCKATYIGKDNVKESEDKGTLAAFECNVIDYDGYPVFKEVPED